MNVEGGPVLAHVQAFADEANRLFGTTFGTYGDHDPSREQALDCWDTTADLDALAEWAREHYEHFGVYLVIWRQRKWNPGISDAWRPMEDRGSPTQNHMDHVHLSFEAEAPETFDDLGGFLMALTDEQQERVLDMSESTNAAVGRLEVAVRDQTGGLGAKLDEVLVELRKLNDGPR